jgi:hypothetical protein
MISIGALKETITKLMKVTYYMQVTKKPTNTKKLKLYEQEYEGVKECMYPGIILTGDNDIPAEIKQRIVMDNKTSYGLKKQLYSPNMNRQTKCTLYKTHKTLILTYGSECPLAKDRNMLRIFERKI